LTSKKEKGPTMARQDETRTEKLAEITVNNDEEKRPAQPINSIVLIQFNIPVEIVPPTQGRILDADRERNHWHPSGFHRRPNEPHSCFLRRSSALLIVAGKTGSNNVLPVGLSALHLRYYMIERKVLCRVFDPAVLAGIFVALVDIGPRETDLSFRALDPDEFEQTEYGGKLEGDRHTPDVAVVEVDYLDLALGQQGDRPLPGDDL